MATVAALAAYFAVLLAGFFIKSRKLRGRWPFLLRSFFPNWRFFDSLGHVPVLMIRRPGEAWQPIVPRFKRRLSHLLFNPRINLALTEQSLLEHLLDDIADLPEGGNVRDLETYRLVERNLRERHEAPFQFCLCQSEIGMAPDAEADLILLSPMLQP